MLYYQINANFEVDFERSELVNRKTKTRTTLEPRLAKVLHLLVQRQGQLLSRKEIIDKIWGSYESGDELLTHTISLLRKQLNDNKIIKTVPKKGYIFIGSAPEVVSRKKWFHLPINKYHVWSLFILLLFLITLKGIFWPHH